MSKQKSGERKRELTSKQAERESVIAGSCKMEMSMLAEVLHVLYM